jgi:hypothetical protein
MMKAGWVQPCFSYSAAHTAAWKLARVHTPPSALRIHFHAMDGYQHIASPRLPPAHLDFVPGALPRGCQAAVLAVAGPAELGGPAVVGDLTRQHMRKVRAAGVLSRCQGSARGTLSRHTWPGYRKNVLCLVHVRCCSSAEISRMLVVCTSIPTHRCIVQVPRGRDRPHSQCEGGRGGVSGATHHGAPAGASQQQDQGR